MAATLLFRRRIARISPMRAEAGVPIALLRCRRHACHYSCITSARAAAAPAAFGFENETPISRIYTNWL